MQRQQQQQQQQQNAAAAAAMAAANQPGWFRGAPASKLFCLTTVILYIFLNSQKALSLMAFDSERILKDGQWYRYFSSQYCFGSTGELITGTLLLAYWMRPLEREMGTRQYALFALVLIPFVAAVLQGVAVRTTLVSSSSAANKQWIYSGPYPLLGAHLAWFHVYVPRLHPRFAVVLGLTFSEKAMIYLWATQVVAAGQWHTVSATAVGVVAWFVYRQFLASNVVVPNAVAKTVASVLSRWTDPPPPIIVAATTGGRAPRHAVAAAAAAAAAQQPVQRPARPLAPDPSAIEQLTGMGFGRAQVIEALQATNNNVQRAADRLLSQQ